MNFIPSTLGAILKRLPLGYGAPVESATVGPAIDQDEYADATQAVDAAFVGVVKPEPVASLEELVADMLRDEQVVMALELITSHMQQADVTVSLVAPNEKPDTNADDDPTLVAVTEDLQRLWSESFAKMLDIRNGLLTWGRCAFAKTEENSRDLGITRFSKLTLLPATANGQRATSMKLDKLGNFNGVEVTVGGKTIELSADSVWWCAIGGSILEPYGRSVLMGAPQECRERRKRMTKLTEVFLKRWAISPPTIHADATAKDSRGSVVNNHQAIAETLKRSSEYGNPWILPNDRDAKGEYKTQVTKYPETLDPKPITELSALLADEMALAFGLHPRLANDNATTGSYASVSIYRAVLLAKCDKLIQSILPSFSKYVAEKIVAKNFAAASRPTVVVAAPSLLTEAFMLQLAFSVLNDKEWSPIIASGAINLGQLLRASGAPLSPDFDEKLEAAMESARQQSQQGSENLGDEAYGEQDGLDPLFGTPIDQQELAGDVDPTWSLAQKKTPHREYQERHRIA